MCHHNAHTAEHGDCETRQRVKRYEKSGAEGGWRRGGYLGVTSFTFGTNDPLTAFSGVPVMRPSLSGPNSFKARRAEGESSAPFNVHTELKEF